MENSTLELEILYQDEHFVAVNKPHGMLVHKTKLAAREDVAVLQVLRDQLGVKVNPVHRLDRKTAGVLLFAFSKEGTKAFQEALSSSETQKIYHAICRGFFPAEELVCKKALINDKLVEQEAETKFNLLKTVSIDVPFGKFATSRYSLVECNPKTGRMHQIRKHLNHLRYPIIGDRPHGCNKQNKLFLEKWNMNTMLLHHKTLKIKHPFTNEILQIEANFQSEYLRISTILTLNE